MDGPVSVIDAVHEALRHTRQHLFPLDWRRWLTLGLFAFMDQCGRGTGVGGGGVPGAPATEGGAAFDPRPLLLWLVSNPLPAVLVVVAALAVATALLALVLWVNSRGSFAYVDLVATGGADVARPWRAYRPLAQSYLAVRFALTVTAVVGLLAMALALATAALGVVGIRRPRPGYLLIAFSLLFLMLVFAIVMSVASVLLRDFVVPLQMQGGLSCAGAARLLRSLVEAHPGAFVLYVLLKVAFTLVVAAAMLAACCLTCGLGLLPVVGQAVLQPAYFFERAWSLFLLRQMGHDVFTALARPV